MGLAGAHRVRRQWWFPRSGPPKPSIEMVAELGQAVTRLDRLLGRLVDIAVQREWEPPFPNVADAIARAVQVRGQQPPMPTGEFEDVRAHLRRLALAADDLLTKLTEGEETEMVTLFRFWCHFEQEAPVFSPLQVADRNVAPTPEAAVHWVRQSVRETSSSLDRAAFHRVWEWLGDHRAVQAGVAALHHGEPYGFAVEALGGRRTWTVHRVRELQLASPCGRPPGRSNSLSTPSFLNDPSREQVCWRSFPASIGAS